MTLYAFSDLLAALRSIEEDLDRRAWTGADPEAVLRLRAAVQIATQGLAEAERAQEAANTPVLISDPRIVQAVRSARLAAVGTRQMLHLLQQLHKRTRAFVQDEPGAVMPSSVSGRLDVLQGLYIWPSEPLPPVTAAELEEALPEIRKLCQVFEGFRQTTREMTQVYSRLVDIFTPALHWQTEPEREPEPEAAAATPDLDSEEEK